MGGRIHWIIVLVSIFMIVSLSKSVVDLWERRNILEAEEKRLTQLEKKNDELEQKLRMVQTPAFVEKEARERLGMAKEGETVILMGDISREESIINTPRVLTKGSNDDILGQQPYWKQWWHMFFD